MVSGLCVHLKLLYDICTAYLLSMLAKTSLDSGTSWRFRFLCTLKIILLHLRSTIICDLCWSKTALTAAHVVEAWNYFTTNVMKKKKEEEEKNTYKKLTAAHAESLVFVYAGDYVRLPEIISMHPVSTSHCRNNIDSDTFRRFRVSVVR